MKEASSNSHPFREIQLTGINQRAFLDSKYQGADWIQGLVPETLGVVKKPGGITKLTQINQERILAIHQTFNSNDLILIQTDSAIYSMTLDELMDRVSTPSLVGLPEDYQENMPKAIIIHQAAAGAHAGTSVSAANTYYTAPLSHIVSQTNPDGSAASFITSLASSQITLPAGAYRIEGWSMGSANGGACEMRVRLWNATAGTALFAGLTNEYFRGFTAGAAQNGMVHFTGDFVLVGSTAIEIRQAHSVVEGTLNTGFGRATGGASFITVTEIYRCVTLYKTA